MSEINTTAIANLLIDSLSHYESEATTKVERPTYDNEVQKLRVKFAEDCQKCIDEIIAAEAGEPVKTTEFGEPKTKFAERLKDGRYKVGFVVKATTLELIPGKHYFFPPNADEACKLIAQVVITAQSGALDHLFEKALTTQKKKAPSKASAYVASVKQAWAV